MARRYYRRRKTNPIPQGVILTCLLLVALLLAVPQLGKSLDQSQLLVYVLAGIVVFFGIGLLWWIVRDYWRRRRALQIDDIDVMTGVEFEQYVGDILKTRGLHIEYTKASGDYGGDIVARKDGKKYCIQLKRYNHAVAQEAVREAIAAKAYYTCTEPMVVTNNQFTKAAQELARVNHTILIDRDKLLKWMVEFQDGKKHPTND